MKVETALNLINQTTRNLDGYHLSPIDIPVKLNQNENPLDWPESIKEEIAAFCRERPWNRYPDFVPANLKKEIADSVGMDPENVIVGNGSNEMLLVLMLTLASPQRPVVTCQPTFTVYGLLSRGLGCSTDPVYLNEDLSFDIGRIQKALSANPRALLVLCSPNNPTGTAIEETSLRTILASHEGFVILDQAYVEFGGYNAVELIQEYPNLIVTRTFSKAFGGAGLRLGYMLGNEKVIYEINKMKLPYNVNFFSLAVASTMLKNLGLVEERVAAIVTERDRMTGYLRTQPLENVWDSTANFVLIRTNHKAKLFEDLRTNGVLIRDVSSYPMLENCLRITIGAPEENNTFMECCTRFFEKCPA